ncbi:MAG TPA: hypothetical protein VFT22_01290 [Kofleriaceae bacterium]|nr:hypothetical protein [Kofleriaceae bacterium]
MENQQVRPAEGIWNCIVLGGDYNADDKNIVVARINVQITEGPDKGRKMTYEEQINNKSSKYVVQSMKAVGWKGDRPDTTFKSDVQAWIQSTGGATTVEIQHVERKNGPKAGTFWAKARSIGRGAKPLKPPTQEAADDAWDALQRAMTEQDGGGVPPTDDYVPPPSDEDQPPF